MFLKNKMKKSRETASLRPEDQSIWQSPILLLTIGNSPSAEYAQVHLSVVPSSPAVSCTEISQFGHYTVMLCQLQSVCLLKLANTQCLLYSTSVYRSWQSTSLLSPADTKPSVYWYKSKYLLCLLWLPVLLSTATYCR